jgi:hypothetical protein
MVSAGRVQIRPSNDSKLATFAVKLARQNPFERFEKQTLARPSI